MTTPILQLKSLGIDDLMKFEWVSAPPAETVLRALEGLHAAGMVDDNGRLTPMGEQVAECPVEVGIARMVWSLFYGLYWLKPYPSIFLVVPIERAQLWRGDSNHRSNDSRSSEHSSLIDPPK